MTIEEFNALPDDAAAAAAAVWADVPKWVSALVAARPYPSAAALRDAAWSAAPWSADEVDIALAHHPRIGERPAPGQQGASDSAREQASMSSAPDDVAAAIAAGNLAYEARFGRVFLIRAAGRSPAEILLRLRERLGNDDATESAVVAQQLREIAVLRLEQTVTA
ncbi:2-oxo-4-hydroxy-4-carboxy-5-ureidoimidazoline decarboxylase [Microbacterium sp.]|uniref:2-oxo-4-hydroxy-4-carboxy-5-ureidoimidazoline decarboxylase n=1 Tax=Microbacterium sp. TaxID=51671 RepID=UPI0025F7699C|nr:2-oxo-4-hydroxy-4-carboxy-5-ureidoimidazoline decarboxylase [Microbacterium sp.]